MKVINNPQSFQSFERTIPTGFGYHEAIGTEIDSSIIRSLILDGHCNGKILYVIRNLIDPYWREVIARAFDQHLVQFGSHREGDGYVSTKQIGASQFSRTGTEYIAETHRLAASVSALLSETPPTIVDKIFLTRYQEELFLESGIHFGPARYKNGFANFSTFRRWLNNGAMSLMPHDDKAQVIFAKQDDFEIADATHVIVFNACIEATGMGGELTVWNLEPDEACRQAFGVEKTGYPYPPQYLQDVELLSVNLQPRDVYFLNANFLHGVQTVRGGQRLTAGRFIS